MLVPGGLLCLALAVRYYHLGEAPIWVDEIFSWGGGPPTPQPAN
jgi:hypothetical protein